MTRRTSVALAVVAVFGGILLITGCGTTTRHQYLTFFFDGVPPEGGPKQAAPKPGQPTVAAAARPTPPRPAPNFVHPPFAENKCGA